MPSHTFSGFVVLDSAGQRRLTVWVAGTLGREELQQEELSPDAVADARVWLLDLPVGWRLALLPGTGLSWPHETPGNDPHLFPSHWLRLDEGGALHILGSRRVSVGRTAKSDPTLFTPLGIGHGRTFSTGHEIGKIEMHLPLDALDDAAESLPPDLWLRLVIWPRKLGSPQIAERVFHDLMRLHTALVHSSAGAVANELGDGADLTKSALQRLQQLSHYREELDRVVHLILERPHHRLDATVRWMPAGRVGRVEPTLLHDAVARGAVRSPSGVLRAPDGHLLLPASLPERRVQTTLDTPPNRFAAMVVRWLHGVARHAREDVADAFGTELHRGSYWTRTATDLESWAARLAGLWRTGPLAEADPDQGFDPGNPVLLHDPRYRRLGQLWRSLRTNLAFSVDPAWATTPMRKAYDVYEYWCFVQLGGAVACALRGRGYGEADWKVFQTTCEHSGLPENSVRLTWNRLGRTSSEAVVLSFNYSTGNRGPFRSWSVGLRPDFVLQGPGDRETQRVLVFDAKYRVDISVEAASEQDGSATSQAERRGDWKNADLYKMHTYRDALSPRPAWVVILFPGTERAMFAAHASGRRAHWDGGPLGSWLSAHPSGGVGAWPLIPTEADSRGTFPDGPLKGHKLAIDDGLLELVSWAVSTDNHPE